MKPGDRVRLRSGNDVGTIRTVDDYRAVVAWDSGPQVGDRKTWHVSELSRVAEAWDNPPRTRVEPDPVEATITQIVDDVTDVIASLVRSVCMDDKTAYRDLLELVALRLGGV